MCFTVTPVECGSKCTCHYNQSHKANVFSCIGPQYTQLPHTIPHYTNWMIFDNTKITDLCGEFPYLWLPSNVTYISFKHSHIQTICQETLSTILHNASLTWLDLSDNNMSKIPIEFSTENNIEKLWLEGNPIFCDCSMTWMTGWLQNRGKQTVQNSDHIICARGREVGKPIYFLEPHDMDCYNSQGGMWIAIGTIGGLIVLMVLATGPVARYIDIRWFVYHRFGILIGNPDENDLIAKMEFDAFLSYRLEHTVQH